MKKYYVEFVFSLIEIVKVGGKKLLPIGGSEHKVVLKSKINLLKLPENHFPICLLSKEQIEKVLEEGRERFETEQAIELAFTFTPQRHRGYVKRGVDAKQEVWVEFHSECGDVLVSEACDDCRFIISQLIRFGIVDKIPFPEKQE